MTENIEQQKLLEAIERLLAGESVEATGAQEEDLAQLLRLAEELKAGAPVPSSEFENELGQKIVKLQEERRKAHSAPSQPQRPPRRWLPAWLTMPRLAAVTAALVIALGLTGLTVTLIRGGYQGGQFADNEVIEKTSTPEGTIESTPGAGAELFPGETPGSAAGTDQQRQAAPDAAAGPSPATGSGALPPLPDGQRVVQTADYKIEIAPGEFNDKYSQITALAAKYGGYVVSGDSRSSGDELTSGVITFTVANTGDNFTKVQAELDGIGNVTSRRISGQDVTEEYVDLQSRLRNAEAEEAQLLTLLEKAQTIDEILMVQSRLSEIRSQIEQIKGRIKYMESRTDFATITVDLRETGESGEEDSDDIDWGFVESLKYAGWLAVQTLNFVIMALGLLIPIILIAALLYLLIARGWGWYRSR